MNSNDYVTKVEFKEGMDSLHESIVDTLGGKIDALAEAMAEGFHSLETTKADKIDIARLIETKADKADILHLERIIQQNSEDIREEVGAFVSDVRDDLSDRIDTLADFVGFSSPKRL